MIVEILQLEQAPRFVDQSAAQDRSSDLSRGFLTYRQQTTQTPNYDGIRSKRLQSPAKAPSILYMLYIVYLKGWTPNFGGIALQLGIPKHLAKYSDESANFGIGLAGR